MARKKYIDDNTLITLIDTYYLESGRSERALQLPQITDYINTCLLYTSPSPRD